MRLENLVEDTRVVSAGIGLLAFIVLLTFSTGVFAKPVLRTVSGAVTITLYDDKKTCSQASNLPRKAVWLEGGKATEGCWGVSSLGVVMFWFEDNTVASAPATAFVEINEA